MTDAFGKPPAPTQQMIDLAELRIAASTLDVESLKLDGKDLIFRTANPQLLEEVLADARGRVTLLDPRTVYWRPPENYLGPDTLLAVLRKVLVRPVREGVKQETAVVVG